MCKDLLPRGIVDRWILANKCSEKYFPVEYKLLFLRKDWDCRGLQWRRISTLWKKKKTFTVVPCEDKSGKREYQWTGAYEDEANDENDDDDDDDDADDDNDDDDDDDDDNDDDDDDDDDDDNADDDDDNDDTKGITLDNKYDSEVVYHHNNIAGKITECWLVNEESIFS